MIRLRLRPYIGYKFLNSLFTGLSVGAVFTLYTPLEPAVFSAGGVALALGMLIVARFYHRWFNLASYRHILLIIEAVPFGLIQWYLLHPTGYLTALTIYAGYQLTFAFGAYLMRAETLLLRRDWLLTRIDYARQSGYLGGMLLAWGIYTLMRYCEIQSPNEQVYMLHFLLLITQLGVLTLLLTAFRRFK